MSQRLPRILVVDDEPDIRFICGLMLRGRCDVLEANSGEEALQILQDVADIDLVLLDVRLPGINGFQVLDALQTEPLPNRPRVLMISAAIQLTEQMCRTAGADGFVDKVFDPAMLRARINELIEATHLERTGGARSQGADRKVTGLNTKMQVTA